MDKWALVHDYRRLVRRGIVNELLCPDDDTPLQPKLGRRDEPTFVCYTCDSKFLPGLDFYDQIKGVKG